MLELLKLNNAKFKEGNEQDQLYDHQNLVKMIMESPLFKNYEGFQHNDNINIHPTNHGASTAHVTCQ